MYKSVFVVTVVTKYVRLLQSLWKRIEFEKGICEWNCQSFL
jgi:hypothetical protein